MPSRFFSMAAFSKPMVTDTGTCGFWEGSMLSGGKASRSHAWIQACLAVSKLTGTGKKDKEEQACLQSSRALPSCPNCSN